MGRRGLVAGGDHPLTEVPETKPRDLPGPDRESEDFISLNADGVEKALRRLEFRWRGNERAGCRLEMAPLRSDPHLLKTSWQALDDNLEAELFQRIQGEFWTTGNNATPTGAKTHRPAEFSKARRTDSLRALAHRTKVDPVQEWFKTLPEWDGTERLSTLLSTCFEVEEGTDSDLSAWCSYSPLLAAVVRTFNPGAKHDEMVVLVGPQGIGKSTYWGHLLPPETRDEWFSDTFSFHADYGRQIEATNGRVLVEAAEMRGSNRAELESIKAFMSRQTDQWRLPYGHHPTNLPRRFVLVGSADQDGCLPNDPGGLRRFVPLRLAGGDPKHVRRRLAKHRRQLWAEAVAMHERDVPARPPEAITEVRRDAAERHRLTDDIVEEAVARGIQECAFEHNARWYVSSVDIARWAEERHRNLNLSGHMWGRAVAIQAIRKTAVRVGNQTRKVYEVNPPAGAPPPQLLPLPPVDEEVALF